MQTWTIQLLEWVPLGVTLLRERFRHDQLLSRSCRMRRKALIDRYDRPGPGGRWATVHIVICDPDGRPRAAARDTHVNCLCAGCPHENGVIQHYTLGEVDLAAGPTSCDFSRLVVDDSCEDLGLGQAVTALGVRLAMLMPRVMMFHAVVWEENAASCEILRRAGLQNVEASRRRFSYDVPGQEVPVLQMKCALRKDAVEEQVRNLWCYALRKLSAHGIELRPASSKEEMLIEV